MLRGHCFSETYPEARRRFLEAAAAAGLAVERHENPSPGPDGSLPTCEVAWAGPREAERVLVLISATHGGEGFCGSGAQVGWIESGLWRESPKGTASLMLHGINPHGFAWMRRVTEDNVDLNRNFPDFAAPLPENPGYELLHEAICPPRWDPETRRDCDRRLADYAAAEGAHALQAAVTGGQYRHADGIFYGGRAPTWSHRKLVEIFRTHLGKARHVAVIDYHTGLGPYGYGERICVHPVGGPAAARARDWYGGDVTFTSDGSSSSAPIAGSNVNGMLRALPEAEITAIALEYGTLPLSEVLAALRADNWLHAYGNPDSAEGREIKAAMRKAFYPAGSDWKDMVWERAVETQRLALAGLAAA